ncbi:MAG: transposase, partial [Methanothermobacter sp.]|nr:transposase [Methanothermobacter sp.]
SSNMLAYKAENAGKRAVKVNPKGTSKGLTPNNPYQDHISATRILDSGLGQPPSPRKTPYSASPASVVVAGQVSSLKQEIPPIMEG